MRDKKDTIKVIMDDGTTHSCTVNALYDNKDEDKMLVYVEETRELIWVNGDNVTHIEPTSDIHERARMVSYFGEFMPIEPFSFIVARLKGRV